MKQGGNGLKGIIEQAKKVATSKVKGDCYMVGINIDVAGNQTWLYYTAEHVAKIEAFVKRPENKARREVARLPCYILNYNVNLPETYVGMLRIVKKSLKPPGHCK